MKQLQSFRKSRLAGWGFRLSVISAHIVVFTVLLHRFAGQATPVSLNLLQIGFIGAFAALILSIMAAVQIWNQLLSGFGKAVTGLVLSALVLAWPLFHLPFYLISDKYFDVTTDIKTPPAFEMLLKQRSFGANPVKFELIGEFDDDVTPLRVNKSAQDVFDLARQLVLKRQWEVVSARAPSVNRGVGVIEAVALSQILQAPDDIVIRVVQKGGISVLDIRSAARYGAYDIGRNEDRILEFLSDILTQNAGVERVLPGEDRFQPLRKGRQRDQDNTPVADVELELLDEQPE